MSRVGKFLITRPTANLVFKQQVILISEETEFGTAGVCLTSPTAFCLRNIAHQIGVDYPAGQDLIYYGGPVAQNLIAMVHTDDFNSYNTLYTGTGINLSSDDLMITKLLSGNRPQQFRLVTGGCVWAPGQLDQEIQRGFWLESKLTRAIVFDLDQDQQWKAAIQHASSELVAQYF
jgi:putative transcriptional regulator